MNWKLKALVQKSISFLPYSHRVNVVMHQYFTVGKELSDDFVLGRIDEAIKHLDAFKRFSKTPLNEASILEIGTGWFPIVPFVMRISGVPFVESTDIRKLYDNRSFNQTIRVFLRMNEAGLIKEKLEVTNDDFISKLKLAHDLESVESKFNLLGIKSIICSSTDFTIPHESKDFIFSNNTLQYLLKSQLEKFVEELNRMLKPNGIMSHSIDLTDEFSHKDKTISNFNFLKYSEKKWKFISNHLNRPNRLRFSDFKNSFLKKLDLLEEKQIAGKVIEIDKVSLHHDFANYEKEDLLIKLGHLTMKKKDA